MICPLRPDGMPNRPLTAYNITGGAVMDPLRETKQMSIGQDRVRISFNPSSDSLVDELKRKTADLIDMCEAIKTSPGEISRCAALAQTAYEEAAMWAVKAATGK
jgi:hypothetical protein